MQGYQQCHTPVDKCNAIKIDILIICYLYIPSCISVKYQKLIKTLTNDFWDIPKCHRKRNVWVIKSKRATLYEPDETPEGTEN